MRLYITFFGAVSESACWGNQFSESIAETKEVCPCGALVPSATCFIPIISYFALDDLNKLPSC
jgi:hypothetical protein